MENTVWTSPLDQCQLCDGDYNGVMYDAKTQRGWANMCQPCFEEFGIGLGIGFGQRYDLSPADHFWHCVAGASAQEDEVQ